MAVNYKHDLSKNKLHEIYNNMHTRCTNSKYHKTSPQYKDCKICPEWQEDKNTFYEWVRQNYYTIPGEQIDLDKDILAKGNKIYSPDTCIFAPHSINLLFESLTRKPIYKRKSKTYKMDINIDNQNITLGYFDTEEKAKKEYIKHKMSQILTKADYYKNMIPDKLYKAMTTWEIILDDWDKN